MRHDASTEPTHVHRRALVRAGATAAWAVPVIVLAAPAQAASCSGGATTLTAVKLPGTLRTSISKGDATATLKVQVCDSGTAGTCALSATVIGTCGDGGGGGGGGGGDKDNGGDCTQLTALAVGSWPGASASGNGVQSLTVSAPADQQLGAGQCTTYDVTFTLKGKDGTVTITFRTTNGGTSSVTVTI